MTAARVTRDVARGEPHNHSGRDVAAGETFSVFGGHAYELIDPATGIALSESGPVLYPFFEFPRDAVEVTPEDDDDWWEFRGRW